MKTRCLIAVLLVTCSSSFAAQPGPAATRAARLPALLDPGEAEAVRAVIEAVRAAGFPDTQNSVVYSGKVAVSATFDPAKDPSPLPSRASNTQTTIAGSTRMTYGYGFEGLHFKLADGSWILAMAHRFTPKPGDVVGTAKATEVRLATLTADAAAASPFDAAKAAAPWLDQVSPAQRVRATAAMDRVAPVAQRLDLDADDLAPAAVLLHRAGWADAPDLSLAIADQRARSYWQLRPWAAPDPAFDPTGEYSGSRAEEAAWRKATTQFTSEPPQVALRRALFRWCRAQLMVDEPADALLPAAAAAAAAKAAADPKDPQGNAARIDALAAGARLPVTPATNAGLASRLQSWEAGRREPRMTVRSGASGAGGNAIGISTAFAMPEPAYVPDKADLDGLVALLADDRPSRFADFAGPRTVGVNAWRALAALLEADPRKLADHPADRPWTAAERKAATAAVQSWWKENRQKHVKQ